MRVLVTVGSTEFEGLISLFNDEDFLAALAAAGYSEAVVQHGAAGAPCPPKDSPVKFVDVFAFHPQLSELFSQADLVISHGGAGTALEVQRAGRRQAIVCNDLLMDNHQMELVDALSNEGHALGFSCPAALRAAVLNGEFFTDISRVTPRSAPVVSALTRIVDEMMNR